MSDKNDLPDRIWVERDAETNEKRWYSIKGMGVEYVRASLPTKADDTDTRGSEPTVKPLEWTEHPSSFPSPMWGARTPFGFYNIEEISASDSPAYEARWEVKLVGGADSLEQAKAAAQADYETRIRSALARPLPLPREEKMREALEKIENGAGKATSSTYAVAVSACQSIRDIALSALSPNTETAP
jgi:hypothetical protein